MENEDLSIVNSQLSIDPIYQDLLERISEVYTAGRSRAHQAVNGVLIETYWQIGRGIVEFEQGGKVRAEYGKGLLVQLSRDLSLLHGKGFSRSNLTYMRLFYVRYPICEKPSHILSWSHYVELLKLDNALERRFYEQQSILERWSVPELKRQKKAALFLRLATGKNREEILKLAEQGQADAIRFLQQCGWGTGNYTQERGAAIDCLTRDDFKHDLQKVRQRHGQ